VPSRRNPREAFSKKGLACEAPLASAFARTPKWASGAKPMKGQVSTLTKIKSLRHSHAQCVKIAHPLIQLHHASGPFWLKRVLGTAYALLLIATCSVGMCIPAKASTPFPNDLQLVPTNSLPAHASWYSVKRWGHFPPSLVNWCASRDNVLYYRSTTFGTNRIIIDDSAVDYTQQPQPPTLNSGGESAGPGRFDCGTNLCLEIQWSTNCQDQVDLFLHNTTQGLWEIQSRTNLSDPNEPWTFVDLESSDGSTPDLYCGTYSAKKPPIRFFRAISGPTNLFEVVTNNLPNPVGIDYHPTNYSLILPVNYFNNDPAFGILDTNLFFTNWSLLGPVNAANEVRLTTVKVTTNGLAAGELLFGNGDPGGIGWLSADGTVSNLNWAVLPGETNLVEALYVDQTGVWSNDLLVVAAQDTAITQTPMCNMWRVHFRTNFQLVASIETQHLEGALTLPNDPLKNGPWAGKFLCADETLHAIYAVGTDGSFTNFSLGIDADSFHLIPQEQHLYCINFLQSESMLLKLPGELFVNYSGDVLAVQAGETAVPPRLFIIHWTGCSFGMHGISLLDFLPSGFFEKAVFAPINMPTLP
jgi:hypothetical protein